ncbi:tyrosine-type recombinase/integrase [Sphingobacterium bovistauri]|uniref:Site-specific integrase n=1 Tax=Sphingobacterium bovistauri TaxID=2781959 RepID=A0ABS7ZAE1_9SPHI|nr:tyrosine-type recombinase/integrase [Sphingobacterium bovistauri]MCA5006371.1 site-specific integrase [Sphingobacterium bovistauri]
MNFLIENYKIEESRKENRHVLVFHFSMDNKLRKELKEFLPTVRWSMTDKVWWVHDTVPVRRLLGMRPRDFTGEELLVHMSTINAVEFNNYLTELHLKGYSPNTIKTYAVEFAQLLYVLKDNAVRDLTTEKLRSYLFYCIKVQQLSENQIHSRLNALKFYFESVLKQEKFFFEIPRPKKINLLPKVLSTKEIARLFGCTTNLKHLMMLKLCYGMGLRVSEVANLHVSDIDSDRMQVRISCSKNKKDRYVPLPESILPELRAYYIQYKPKDYLFEGQLGGTIAIRTIQAVFKISMRKAKINKKVGIHGLRHSYATHLLEYGTDMSFIQKLLGHNHISTTEIYAQVSNKILSKVQSPLDRM